MNILPLGIHSTFQLLAQQGNSTQSNSQTFANLSNNIPTVIATLGIALLGILIPLTIAILQDLLQKKNEQSGSFCILDLHVILDKVFQTKRLICYSFLVFIPLLFWDIQIGIFRLAEIILAFIGIALILLIILKVYNWIKGNISKYRNDYLEGLDNESDMVVVWRSIWQNNNITPQEFRDFFEIYNKKIDGLMKKNGGKP